MKKWLDKYEDGGEYLGTTNKGFNYNGAWGGPSMQMGGYVYPTTFVPQAEMGTSLPGSVGFTYARTKGIPSEGPYGKKTVPSAQDGKTIDSNQEFLKNWYSKRKIEDPYIQEAFELDRPAYMKNLQSMPEYTMVENIDNDPNITGRYESDKNKLLITKNAPEHVKTHELNHYLNNLGAGEYMRSIHKDIVRNELLPQSQMQGVYKNKYNYFSDPDEVHSRIMVLRQKAGFKPNETITPEKLKGFMKIYKGDVDNINDLLNMSKGEQGLLNMLNFMAKGTSYTPTIAQNGGEMQFYQNGLDWTPRNISEYGSEIPMAQPGITQPMRGDIQTRGNQNLLTEIAAQRTKEKKAQAARERTTIKAPRSSVKHTSKEIEKLNKEVRKKEFFQNYGKPIIQTADVVTDIMQLGNFIPHPIGQSIGKVGNILGATIDASQAVGNAIEGDYTGSIVNAASAGLPNLLSLNSFRRNSKYLRPGQPLYPFSPQAGILPGGYDRVQYIEPFTKVKGMTNSNLLTNRALLGSLGAETIYDAIPQKKKGGVVKDNHGYWNPNNWGRIVEIDSPNITMKGVNQDLIGVSDTGDVQYMTPENDYKFKGEKVKEYPVGKYGVNQQDEKTVQHLDQLLNFTNKPKAKNGWLSKYE